MFLRNFDFLSWNWLAPGLLAHPHLAIVVNFPDDDSQQMLLRLDECKSLPDLKDYSSAGISSRGIGRPEDCAALPAAGASGTTAGHSSHPDMMDRPPDPLKRYPP